MNKICVYAICKNEISTIKSWINNVYCADYIVIIDTGSTDGTWEFIKSNKNIIAEQKIFSPFRFDDARNYAISKCPMDANILLCLDIDEVISDGWTDIIKSKWFDGIHEIGIVNYKLFTKECVENYSKEKIHTRNFCWAYPVHESLSNSINFSTTATINIEEKQIFKFTDITISHKREHPISNRYDDLLKLGVEEFPNCARCECMLGRDFLSKGKVDEAKDSFERCINKIDLSNTHEYIVFSYDSLASMYAEKNPCLSLYYASCAMQLNNAIIEPYLLMAESYLNMNNYDISESILKYADNYCEYSGLWVETKFSWDVKRYFLHAVNNYYLNNINLAKYYIDKAVNNYKDSNELIILKNEIDKIIEQNTSNTM